MSEIETANIDMAVENRTVFFTCAPHVMVEADISWGDYVSVGENRLKVYIYAAEFTYTRVIKPREDSETPEWNLINIKVREDIYGHWLLVPKARHQEFNTMFNAR